MDKNTDNNKVVKVMTFKSGQFGFSQNFDRTALERFLIEARVLKQAVADLPILPSLASSLNEETIRQAIYSTAAIEGNPLKEEQVSSILGHPQEARSTVRAEQEIINLRTAYSLLLDTPKGLLSPGSLFLDEDLILNVHKIITRDIPYKHNVSGSYRDWRVKVGDMEHGGPYTPPKILKDIHALMKKFVAWINSAELMQEEPLIQAALAHYHLGLIHPFGDGNGRTARLMEAYILHAHGLKRLPLMLSNYYYTHVDDYYLAFSHSQRSKTYDVTPFVELALKAFIDALVILREKITFAIRRFTLREFVAFQKENKRITQRQHDLLILLLDNPKQFSLNMLTSDKFFQILYRDVSEKTARRDIKKLVTNKLLICSEKPGMFLLNFWVLD